MTAQLPPSTRRLSCGNGRIRGNGKPRRVREHPRGVADLREQIDMTKRTCSVPECDRPSRARGWCHAHYYRWKTYGDPEQLRPSLKCSVDECDRPHSSRGYCAPHYARWRRTGATGAVEIAPPSTGGSCSIQGCDRRHKARGYCQQHYNRWLANGAPGPANIRASHDSRARDAEGRKRCARCARWCPVAEFAKFHKSADGLTGYCYRCHRTGVLRRTYGVTIEWYEKTLAAQGGVCALCFKTNHDGRLLAVDHDHACCPGRKSCGNCARALLCTKCNTGLGAFGDDVVLMAAAIEYVKAARKARRGDPD